MPSARFPHLPSPRAAIDRLTSAGVKPPAELVDLADRTEALQQAQSETPAFNWLDVPVSELPGAIREAAIRQAIDANLHVLVGTIAETLDIKTAKVLKEHSEGFLTQARGAFDAAAEELGRVVQILGTDPNPGSFSQPADSAKIEAFFGSRSDALSAMTRAADISNLLATVTYLDAPRRAAWYLHPDDAPRLAEAQRIWTDHQASPFEFLLAAGIRLHLNSAGEVLTIEAGAEANQPAAHELHPPKPMDPDELERTWGL